MENEIQVGDVARVRGIEGPAWVVERARGADFERMADCLRFGPDGGAVREVFPVAVLERVEGAGTGAAARPMRIVYTADFKGDVRKVLEEVFAEQVRAAFEAEDAATAHG